jgi:LEA14-like dessication related protein
MSAIRRAALVGLAVSALAACAGLGLREPVRVSLAGLEPLAGAGMEARFVARIRVQNPNEAPIAYDGLSVEVDLNGRSFASGVSDAATRGGRATGARCRRCGGTPPRRA